MMVEWNWYKRKRWELQKQVCGHKFPMCQLCGKVRFLDVETLHFHHLNEDEGHESGIGGKQHLLEVMKDIEKGIEVELRCVNCHKLEHQQETFIPMQIEAVV